jgi:galactofuranose transport system substrate-binding protein
MTRSTAHRVGVAVASLACVASLAACGGRSANQQSAGGAPATGAASKATIDKFLLPPAGADHLAPAPGPVETGPITKGPLALPYEKTFGLPAGPIGDPKKTYKFCFSEALIRHPWAVAQKESIMLEAARHPNVKVLYYNTDDDPLKQVQDIDTCMAQKVDAILVWPHSVGPLTPEIEKAKKAGFLVIGMERTVATHDFDSWLYLDYKKATADLADAVGEKLGGKGVVAETSGAIGSSPQILRHAGFADELKAKYPNIKLVTTAPTDYSRAEGYKVALDFLQSPKGQHVDAWYVHSGEIAIGIYKAMQQLHRTDIPIFTIDGSKTDVEMVKQGKFAAVAPWTPLHADIAFRMAALKLEGKPIPSSVLLSFPGLITKANADEQLSRAWGPLESGTA